MTTQRFDHIVEIAGADDWHHDPFGTAMGMFFDLAEVLNMSDVAGDVTPEPFARWDFHPSPYVSIPALEDVAARAEDFAEGEWADDYTYGQIMLAAALHDEEITQADLIYAGDILSKYVDLLSRAGKDY